MLFAPMIAITLTLSQAPPSNLLCPVTGWDVSNHLVYKWVEVHGRRYFVYDRRAGESLKRSPDQYLLPDGTPRVERRVCPCGHPVNAAESPARK